MSDEPVAAAVPVERKSLLAMAVSCRGRALELAVGLAANKVMVIGFDWVLYPWLIYRLGILRGGILATGLSWVTCLLTFWFYDWSKRDWLGIEAIKGLQEYVGRNPIRRWTGVLMRTSRPALFLVLTVYSDPFITTIYLRKGQFSGLSREDWFVFNSSVVLGNAYWTVSCYLGVTALEWLWRQVAAML